MAKFRSPFSVNELIVTQTYHTTGGNTAVDFSAVAETPVYAVADGVVTYRSSTAGSYCIQSVDNSDLKLYYVHTYKWVNANTRVKKGDIVCYVAPTSVNGGYPTHLHLGLQSGRYLMDYMDRSIVFKAGFTWGGKDNLEIRNAWFGGGSNLNWSLFKDLSYTNDLSSAYKIGDIVEFTGTQNIRQGSGTSYPTSGSTGIGQTATIIGGARVADGYTWWDMRITGGGTGWLADVGKWKIYVAPPQAPEMPSELVVCQNKVEDLEADIVTKTKRISSLTEELEGSKGKVASLEGELKSEKNKVRIAEERVSHVEGLLDAEREEAKKIEQKIEKMEEDYARIEKEKLDLQEELSKGSLVKATTGEIFAELWSRVIRSIK